MKHLKSLGATVVGLVALACVSASPLFADSLVLRSGEHVQGKFAGGTQGVIAFVTDRGTIYYNVSDVLAMTFETEPSGPANGSSSTPKLPSSGQNFQPESRIEPSARRAPKTQVRISQQTDTRVPAHKARTSS